VIEINGESITKSAFQARNIKAVEDAAKRLPELRARERTESDARRNVLLDKRAAELAEANKKAEAEVAKLPSMDPIGKRARNRRPICSKEPRKQRQLNVPTC